MDPPQSRSFHFDEGDSLDGSGTCTDLPGELLFVQSGATLVSFKLMIIPVRQLQNSLYGS